MSKAYTLHLPADAVPGDARALDDAELVRDGFSWAAFLLGPFAVLWFFWHRLWLAGLGTLIAFVAFVSIFEALRLDWGTAYVAQLLFALLIGFEANSLRRWTLRKRKPAVDIVTAADPVEAEAKAFARWLANTPEPKMPVARAFMPPAPYRAEPVIGLFPETERRR